MSSHSDELPTVHQYNVSRKRKIVYSIIESVEHPCRRHREHWEETKLITIHYSSRKLKSILLFENHQSLFSLHFH